MTIDEQSSSLIVELIAVRRSRVLHRNVFTLEMAISERSWQLKKMLSVDTDPFARDVRHLFFVVIKHYKMKSYDI